MQIGKKDIIWYTLGTFMRVASGIIILPIVLSSFSKEEYGLWTIFIYIGTIATLLDFGFENAFSRNITYIFSGVKELKKEGYVAVPQNDKSIDFGLLKSVIVAMKKYYAAVAGLFLVIFAIVSPFYLPYILRKNSYTGNHNAVWLAWLIYGILIAYRLYTYYYSSLLNGRGMVKRNQQAIIIGQSIKIITIYIMILMHFGLIALVVGQFIGDLTMRTVSHIFFYDEKIKIHLKVKNMVSSKEILKIMLPNALKIGGTLLGGLLITKAVVPLASLFLPFALIGSFGITKMMIDLIASIGAIWFQVFYPKITWFRVNDHAGQLKSMYIKGKFFLILTFLIFGTGMILVGPYALEFINSSTSLLPNAMIIGLMIVVFLESNQSMSAQMLLTKNEVPFMKASILTGLSTMVLLLLELKYTNLGVWALILAPGIADAVYQNWKWPFMVWEELNIKSSDYLRVIKSIKI